MLRAFLLFKIVIVLLGTYSIYGQTSSTTASIAGVVRNSIGEGVPNVSITLRDIATNQKRRIASDSNGGFRITALAVGTYEVRAESNGFA
ncbi:MAG: carboxypeptidase-like regulatory domain-containing protein, partial [Acidobacteriota bacterium]